MKVIVAVIGLSAMLCACAGVTPPESGEPTPDFRAVLVANKGRLFKDPDSVRDASISPFKPAMFGWRACLRANSKNSFGGYTGLNTYSVLIYKNGSPPLVQEPTIYDGCGAEFYDEFRELEGNYVPPTVAPPPQKPPAKPRKLSGT
jgi:hypothetical protein